MATRVTLILILLVQACLFLSVHSKTGLRHGFYDKTCPGLESIVHKTMSTIINGAPGLAAPLLRMQFHDCMVRGCDASVLLNSAKGKKAEKDARPNLSLRGFQVIDIVKDAVEQKCPGVVSCSDILSLVARDAVSLINGPHWEVPLGRRDGTVSKATEASTFLPPPFANINQLISSFSSIGLSVKDLVVLSGAHTIGVSQCAAFSYRLRNFTGKGDADPTLNPTYVNQLKGQCKPGVLTATVPLDPGSARKFDEDYYTVVSEGKGLLESDNALLHNAQTKAYVKLQSRTHGATFAKDFAASMVKMGQVGVITGTAGQIRKHCAFVN